jgi:ribosomal protein L15E
MHRVSTYITEAERDALVQLALEKRRDPREQAAVLISEGLKRQAQAEQRAARKEARDGR